MTSKWPWVSVVIAIVVLQCAVACVSGIQLVTTGGKSAEQLMQTLQASFRLSGSVENSLTYFAIGSGTTRCRLVDYRATCWPGDEAYPRAIDLGVVESIYTDLATSYVLAPDLQLLPMATSAVVPCFNIAGISDLRLSLDVLADIFRACKNCDNLGNTTQITRWDDPRILALNPPGHAARLAAAGDIVPIVRTDSSSISAVFKRSLARASPAFLEQIGEENIGNTPVWRNITALRGNTNRGTASLLLSTPGAIAYLPLDEAHVSRTKIATLKESIFNPVTATNPGGILPTSESCRYAMTEQGFDFGNAPGDPDPSHLTSVLDGVQGSEAWPISAIYYFGVRLETLRPGATCEHRRATYQFLEWFYTSKDAAQVVDDMGFVVMPEALNTFILNKLATSFKCNGQLISDSDLYVPPFSRLRDQLVSLSIPIVASPQATNMASLFANSFINQLGAASGISMPVRSQLANNPQAALNAWQSAIARPRSGDSRRQLLEKGTTFEYPLAVLDHDAVSLALADAVLGKSETRYVPFAVGAYGVVYNFCSVNDEFCDPAMDAIDLVLTPELVLWIFTGVIRRWNDPLLTRVQPEGSAPLPDLPIRVIGYDLSPSETEEGPSFRDHFERLLTRRLDLPPQPPFVRYTTEPELLAKSGVQASRYMSSIIGGVTFRALTSIVSELVFKVARIRSSDDTPPLGVSAESMRACTNDTNIFADPAKSLRPDCYPLVEAYYLAFPRLVGTSEECGFGAPQQAVAFAEFTNSESQAIVQVGLSDFAFSSAQRIVGGSPDSRETLQSFSCFDRSIAAPVTNMRLIPIALVWVGRALAIVVTIGLIVLAGWVWKKRAEPVIRASTPPFQIQMLVGLMFQTVTIFALSMQDGTSENNSQAMLDAACASIPWTLALGMTITFTPMIVKTYRVYRLFHNPGFSRFTITNRHLWIAEMVLNFPMLLLVVVWTAVSPLHWVRRIELRDEPRNFTISTIGLCESKNSTYFIVFIVVYLLFLIIFTLVLAWKNRHSPSDFSEGRYITAAIVVYFEALAIGAPIVAIAISNPTASFLVRLLLIIITVLAATAFLYVSKIAVVHGLWEESSGGAEKILGRKPPAEKSSKGKDPSGVSNSKDADAKPPSISGLTGSYPGNQRLAKQSSHTNSNPGLHDAAVRHATSGELGRRPNGVVEASTLLPAGVTKPWVAPQGASLQEVATTPTAATPNEEKIALV